MKPFAILSVLALTFVSSSSFKPADVREAASCRVVDVYPSFSQSNCTTSSGGNVHTFELMDGGSKVGYAVWISRQSQRVKARYFAYKQSGSNVYSRYEVWRSGKKVVLMSSGAYASTGIPVGVTVDYGNIVNRKYDDKMDGLVIVYATGGIVVSNAEDGDLYLDALGKKIDIRDVQSRTEFLNWAESENATVFQTHLLAYTNELRFHKDTKEKARRKFLVLAKSGSGELFHIIFYTKYQNYSLYEAAEGIMEFLHGMRMDVTAIVNLDTGMYDIMGTGEGARDCEGNFISGTTAEREKMTNLLAYEFN